MTSRASTLSKKAFPRAQEIASRLSRQNFQASSILEWRDMYGIHLDSALRGAIRLLFLLNSQHIVAFTKTF